MVVDKGDAASGPRTRWRLTELQDFLAELKDATFTDGDFNAFATFLVDAGLDADQETLHATLSWLQWQYARRKLEACTPEAREECGRLLGFIDVARWALQRAPAVSLIPSVEQNTLAARFLEKLETSPGLDNSKLAVELGNVDPTQISRVGRSLIGKGLAVKRRIGRWNYWELTPRGRKVVRILDNSIAPEAVTGYELASSSDRSRRLDQRRDVFRLHFNTEREISILPAPLVGEEDYPPLPSLAEAALHG